MLPQRFPDLTGLVLRAVLVLSIPAWPGCERKERVLDVETPGLDIEVDRSDDGSLEIDIEDRRRTEAVRDPAKADCYPHRESQRA